MATTSANTFLLLFTFAFTVLLPPTLSGNITPTPTHDVVFFDVSSSLQQIKLFLSQNLISPLQNSSSSQSPSNSAIFTLSLHPRASLSKPNYANYSSLTLSRLARDSARVHSLTSKLGPDSVRPQSNLQTPVASGVSQGSGEYFTRLGIGTPTKHYYMVLDTGSDVNWIQCQPCSDCYQQSDPIFNPTDSSSYGSLTCDSPLCSSLEVSSCSNSGGSCLYQVSYGDGSFTIGDFVTETVTFGNSGSVPKVAIGCGHDNEGLFIGAAGLLGLGGGSLSLPSQMKAKTVSYCLVNRDSTDSSTLEFNSAPPADSVEAPLIHNSKMPTFFYVGMTGISVGGKLLDIPPAVFEINGSGRGGIIVDSGTAITRLTTLAYNALRDSFVKMTSDLTAASGFALFDTCYDLSAKSKITVPTVAFHFAGDKTLSLDAKNYLIPVDSGKYCLAFAATTGSLSIIGNVQQQGTRVSYDIANSLVRFSPDKC